MAAETEAGVAGVRRVVVGPDGEGGWVVCHYAGDALVGVEAVPDRATAEAIVGATAGEWRI